MKWLCPFLLAALCLAQPTAPQITSVQAINGDKVYVTWSASTDTSGTGLKQYVLAATAGSAIQYRLADPTKTEAAIVDLTANTPYSITIYATDNTGKNSTTSSAASVTTLPYTSSAPSFNGNLGWGFSANYRRAAQYGTREVVILPNSPQLFHGVQQTYSAFNLAVIDNGTLTATLPLAGFPTSNTCTLDGVTLISCGAEIGSISLLSTTDLVMFYVSDFTVYAAEFTLGSASANLQSAYSHAFIKSGVNPTYVGDGAALASGGWAGYSQGVDPAVQNTIGVWFYRSPSGAWSTTNSGLLSGSQDPRISVAQQPADGTIWGFGSGDAAVNNSITYIKLGESPSGLSVLSQPYAILSIASAVVPNGEDPFIVARANPAHGTIVLGYQANPSSYLSTQFSAFYAGNGPYGPCWCSIAAPLEFVEIGANASLAFKPLMPDFVERISPWGDFAVNGDGSLSVFYANFDTADMSRDILRRRDYTSAGWGTAAVLTEHVGQDLGQVNALPGLLLYDAPDNTMRLLAVTAPAAAPPPLPLCHGKKGVCK